MRYMTKIKTDKIIEEAMNAFHNDKAEEAFELLNHELLEDLNSVEILNALGGLHYESDNLKGALDFWEKSLAIDDNQVDDADVTEFAKENFNFVEYDEDEEIPASV